MLWRWLPTQQSQTPWEGGGASDRPAKGLAAPSETGPSRSTRVRAGHRAPRCTTTYTYSEGAGAPDLSLGSSPRPDTFSDRSEGFITPPHRRAQTKVWRDQIHSSVTPRLSSPISLDPDDGNLAAQLARTVPERRLPAPDVPRARGRPVWGHVAHRPEGQMWPGWSLRKKRIGKGSGSTAGPTRV